MAVNENEKKLEDLKAANDQKQETLNNLKINYDNRKKEFKESQYNGEKEDNENIIESEEILGLKDEISIQKKDLELVQQRKKNIHLVVDLV